MEFSGSLFELQFKRRHEPGPFRGQRVGAMVSVIASLSQPMCSWLSAVTTILGHQEEVDALLPTLTKSEVKESAAF